MVAGIYSHSETSNASRADGSVELGLVVKCPQQSWFSFIEELNYLSDMPCHLIVSPLFLAVKHIHLRLYSSALNSKKIFPVWKEINKDGPVT